MFIHHTPAPLTRRQQRRLAAAATLTPPALDCATHAPRRFVLDRSVDETGVSGCGVIASGVQFPDGRAVVHWHSELACQTSVWDSVTEIEQVHGHGGKTVLRWLDRRFQSIHADGLSV